MLFNVYRSLLSFQLSDLLSKLILQVAEHLGYRTFAEPLLQLTALCELGFYCLFFPIPIHGCENRQVATRSNICELSLIRRKRLVCWRHEQNPATVNNGHERPRT